MFYHALTGNGETGDLEPVLLWKNSNPTATFVAQKISLDLTDYVGIIIEYNEDNSTHQNITGRLYCKKTDNYTRYIGVGFVADGSATYARNVVNVDNSGVEFGSSYTNNAINSQTTHIPVRIYGVKEYVVEPNYSKFTISISNDAGNNTIEQNIFKSAKVINTSTGDSTRDIILSNTNGNTVTIAKGETKVVDISNFEKLSWSTTKSVFVNGTIELTLK